MEALVKSAGTCALQVPLFWMSRFEASNAADNPYPTPRGSTMTKSSTRKAAAEKANRKAARKVGAGKAQDRKTASKAVTEKASGTYRKSAGKFEEFARDAQMPESMRALAEKSVAHTRELYEHSFEAVLGSWERFVDAAGRGAVELNRKAIDIARHNINTGFGLAEGLAGVKNLAEAMELQGAYWRKQFDVLGAQAEEVRALSAKVTAEMAAPIKAQVALGIKGLHKAT
jgi:hypothetical protein